MSSSRSLHQSFRDSAVIISALFEIVLEDASVINKILCEVSDPDENSILIVTHEGLRLVATGDRTSQVSAFFSATTFNSFVFNSAEPVKFRFLLKEFIECLNLLKDEPGDEDTIALKTSLKITYMRKNDPLRLELNNNTNCSINCELREFSLPSFHTMMSFSPEEETTDIVFYSKELYKYISGFDLVASNFIKLIIEPGQIPVKFKTDSPRLGEVELEIYKRDEQPEIIKRALNVPDNMVFNFSYRTQFIRPALDALRTSNYMKMRCGSSGLLLMEHFHGCEPRVQSVEYFILCEAGMC